jgi:hypothetical protein
MSPIVVVDDEILIQNLKQLVWSNCRYGVQILIMKEDDEIILKLKRKNKKIPEEMLWNRFRF